jgi:uncharacterized protein (TIGR02147 family)
MSQGEKPNITTYIDPVDFITDRIDFLKRTQRSFSILQACKSLRKCSPALISLIKKRERQITLDRVDELSKLLKLNAREKQYFKDWISGLRDQDDDAGAPWKGPSNVQSRRKYVGSHILKDWLNIYVKDAFDLPQVQKDPEVVFAILGGIASRNRIEQSIQFLLKEGHLRRTATNQLVTETPLVVTTPELPDQKVRQFHKATLRIARDSIDQYGMDERTANALILALDEDGYRELNELMNDFAEQLQKFSERKVSATSKLYQLLINLSPTGGRPS